MEAEIFDLQKALAFERQRINILKNQIDYILKELNKLKGDENNGKRKM